MLRGLIIINDNFFKYAKSDDFDSKYSFNFFTNFSDGLELRANAVSIGYSVIYFWSSNEPSSIKDKHASTDSSVLVNTSAWDAVNL